MRQQVIPKTLTEKDEEIRLLTSKLDLREKEQKRLKKLASFPELNPNAMVEVNTSGEIQYLNPAAKDLFPDLAEKGVNHPYLGDWEKLAALLKDKAGISINREVKVDNRWFSQSIYINNGESIRIYGSDITERKKTEEALRRSEEKYRTLFESMDEGFALCEMIHDPAGNPVDFRYLEVNSAFARLTGLPTQQIVGRTVNEVVPGMRPFGIGTYSRILQTGIGERIDNFMPELGRHYESYAWRTGDRQFAIVFNDITERKKTEEALKASEEKFRTLFENAPIGIGITSLDGRSIDRNKAVADMYGFKSVEEMLESPVTSRYAHTEDRERFYELLNKGLAKDVEVEMKRVDGSSLWVSLSSIPYVSGFGEKQTISVVQDITKRKNAEEELKQYQNHLEGLVKERTRELEKANSELKREMKIREKAEKALRVSEEKYRTLVENIPVGVSVVTVDGRPVERNKAAIDLFGFVSPDEALRIPSEATYFNPEDRNRILQQLKAGTVRDYEVLRKRKDGSTFWASMTVTPEPSDPENKLIAVALDITERKWTEKALRESEAKYRTLVENLPVGVTVNSKDERVIDRNKAVLDMFGYKSREEALETPFPDTYLNQSDRSRLWQLIEQGPVKDFEVQRRRKDGTVFWALMTVIPEPNDPDNLIITVTQNINERKTAEEALQMQARELAAANTELSAVNKELESFSYSVSHDLRAPLRGIDGFSHILLEEYGDKFDGESKDYLLRVRQASQRMGILIDDLLSLSRVTRSEMREQVVDMSSQAETIIKEFRKTGPERLVDVIIEPGLIVTGDAHLLNIMLVNLLGNAWKFTGRHLRAKIEFGRMNRDEGEVFFVRDDGAGFDMAYAGKLFQPFQRLHGTNEFEGTGIGLATVQRVINRHGGRVWVEGAVEKGAAFYFSIP